MTRQLGLLCFLLIFLTAPFDSLAVDSSQTDVPLKFRVSPAFAEFDRSKAVTLKLKLTLERNSTTGVTVTTYETGTIGVNLAKHNGKRIRPIKRLSRFEE